VLLELTVNPDDMGKIIGKAGATAKAIRTLLRVMGAKHDARYNLKIVEPGEEGSTGQSESSSETKESSEEATAEDIKSKAREGLEDLDVEI
jgi:Sec-independent protein translocase protein TatA